MNKGYEIPLLDVSVIKVQTDVECDLDVVIKKV